MFQGSLYLFGSYWYLDKALTSISSLLLSYYVHNNDYKALSFALLVDVLMLRTCGVDAPHMWC